MNADFEKYLQEQRAALDQIEQPDELQIWQGIQQNLKQQPVKKQWSYRSIALAASILFLLGFGLAYLALPFEKEQSESPLASLAPEFAQEEARYIQLITEKENIIRLDQLDSTQYADIFNDLALLESIQKEYRQDIPQVGPNEKLIKTLIKYYEQKIRILERLTREIEINEKYHEKVIQEQRI